MGLRTPGTFWNALRTVSILPPALFNTFSSALLLWQAKPTAAQPPTLQFQPPWKRAAQPFLNPRVQDSGLANHDHEAVGVGGGQMAHPKRPGGDYGQQTGWLPCSLPAGQCGDCPITPQASGRVGGKWARRLQASALLHSPGLPPASFVATCFTGPAALHTAFHTLDFP